MEGKDKLVQFWKSNRNPPLQKKEEKDLNCNQNVIFRTQTQHSMSKKIRLSGYEDDRGKLSGFVKPHEVGFKVKLILKVLHFLLFNDSESRKHLLPKRLTAGLEGDANVLQRLPETGYRLGKLPR